MENRGFCKIDGTKRRNPDSVNSSNRVKLNQMTVQNPHDKFFRDSFSRLNIARGFLEEYLPPDVHDELQLDTLELQSDSFVDDELQTHQTDILYSARQQSGETAFVYLLFEHKSYVDSDISLQLLRYLVRIWTRQRQNGEALRPIIPIVIYHGERSWNVATDFSAQFDPPIPDALKPYMPQFNYLLRDFSHRSDLDLRGDLFLLSVLTFLRAIKSPTIRAQLPHLIRLATQLSTQGNALEFALKIMYYLVVSNDDISRQDILNAIDSAEGEKLVTTLARQWVEEGIEEGIRRGEENKAKTIARNLLSIMSNEHISKVTGLSVEEVAELRAGNMRST